MAEPITEEGLAELEQWFSYQDRPVDLRIRELVAEVRRMRGLIPADAAENAKLRQIIVDWELTRWTNDREGKFTPAELDADEAEVRQWLDQQLATMKNGRTPDSQHPLSVTPEAIEEQHRKGWPDFHPETYCNRCGQRNVWAWFVASELWNKAVPDDGILCPQCFTEAYAEATGGAGRQVWELRLDPRPPDDDENGAADDVS